MSKTCWYTWSRATEIEAITLYACFFFAFQFFLPLRCTYRGQNPACSGDPHGTMAVKAPSSFLFFWVEPLVCASAGAAPPLYGIVCRLGRLVDDSGCNHGICLLPTSTWVRNGIFGGKKVFVSGKLFFGKKISILHFLCVRCVRLSCNVIFPPPSQVQLSPGSNRMLSCLLLGVRVMQRVHDLRSKHHTSVCGLFMSTGRRRCFCCTLSIFDPPSLFPLGSVVIGGTQVQDRNPPVLFVSFRAADDALGRGVKPVRIPFASLSHISAILAISAISGIISAAFFRFRQSQQFGV